MGEGWDGRQLDAPRSCGQLNKQPPPAASSVTAACVLHNAAKSTGSQDCVGSRTVTTGEQDTNLAPTYHKPLVPATEIAPVQRGPKRELAGTSVRMLHAAAALGKIFCHSLCSDPKQGCPQIIWHILMRRDT